MNKRILVSIVIPAKDEAKNLSVLLPLLRKSLQRIRKYKFEVIVVCNNCKDTSAQVVRKHQFTSLEKNFTYPSKSAALVYGFKSSRGQIIMMLDADVSHRPQDIAKILEPLSDPGVGLVVASRITGHSADETPVRKAGGFVFNILTNVLLGTRLTDAINGFKAFRREIFDKFTYGAGGYAIEIELIANTIRSGYAVSEVPSFENRRMYGQPKSQVLKDGWIFFYQILKEGIKYRFSWVLPLAILMAVVFIVFKPVLNLGLYGDDWAFIAFATKTSRPALTWIQSYFGSYGSATLYMKLINDLFGHQNFLPYYAVSLIFRALASFGMYIFVNSLIKNKKIALLSSLFLAIASTGIQTTDWVFNSPAYLSIFLLFVFLTIFFNPQGRFSKIIMYSAFLFCIILMPNRFNSLPILVFGLDLFRLISGKIKLSTFFKHQLIFVLITYLIIRVGFFGTVADNSSRINSGISAFGQSVFHYPEILLNPFITISNIFIPDSLINTHKWFVTSHPIVILAILLYSAGLVVVGYLGQAIVLNNKGFGKIFLLSYSILVGILFIIHKSALAVNPAYNFYDFPIAIIGSFFIAVSFSLFMALRRHLTYGPIVSVNFFSLPVFVLVPLVFNGIGNPLPTNLRYMIANIVSVSLLWVTVLFMIVKEMPRRTAARLFLAALLVVQLELQFKSTQQFLAYISVRHPAQAVKNIWTTFKKEVPDLPKGDRNPAKRNLSQYALFLFLVKDEPSAYILGSVVDFSSTFKILNEYDKFTYADELAYQFTFYPRDFQGWIDRYHTPLELQYVFEITDYQLINRTQEYRQSRYSLAN